MGQILPDPLIVHVVFHTKPGEFVQGEAEWGPFYTLKAAQRAIVQLAGRSDVKQAVMGVQEKKKVSPHIRKAMEECAKVERAGEYGGL